MFLIQLIILATLIYLAVRITPSQVRNILQAHLEGLWHGVKETVVRSADTISRVTGDLATSVLGLTESFWEALTAIVRRLLIFLVFDWIALMILVQFEVHEGIIGWSMVNGILAFTFVELSSFGHQIREYLADKELKKGFTRVVALVFLSLSVVGLAEWAIPGVFKYSGWIPTMAFTVLIIGEVFSVYMSMSGNAGGKALLLYSVLLIGVGVYNNHLSPHAIEDYLMAMDYKNSNYDLVMEVQVIESSLPVLAITKKNGEYMISPVIKNKINSRVKRGQILYVPASKDDYFREKLPTVVVGRNKYVPFLEKSPLGVYSSQRKYVAMTGTRLYDREKAMADSLKEARAQALKDSLAEAHRLYKTSVLVEVKIKEGDILIIQNPNQKAFKVIRVRDNYTFFVREDEDPATIYMGHDENKLLFKGIGKGRLKVIKINNSTFRVE